MIDTKALRSRILDLAIQGKLSEQLPGESVDTADISLLSEFPYTIPKNWKWTTIQSIISKDVGGGTPSKSMPEYWKNGDIPWMSVKDFSSAKNGVLEDTIDHITQAGLDNSSSNLVDEEAIIICMRMALGKIVKINKPMAINQDLRAIWLKPFIDNNYFVYFYSTLKVEGHGMTVAGISKAQLMSYPFPLPPLAEQKRIVERVEEIFRLLDTIDQAQEKYSADSQILKAKLITAGIQGKLTKQLPSDGTAEELYQQIQAEKQKLIKEGKLKKEKPLPPVSPEEVPFEIPENWMWVHLGEIFQHNTGKALNATNTDGQLLEYITTSNVYWERFELDSLKQMYFSDTEIEKCTVTKGDLLICEGGDIGRSAIWNFDFEMRIQNHLHRLRGYIPDICQKYYYYLMWLYKDKGMIDGRGIGLQGFSSKRVHELVVPLPPLAEQKRIADVLERALGALERK